MGEGECGERNGERTHEEFPFLPFAASMLSPSREERAFHEAFGGAGDLCDGDDIVRFGLFYQFLSFPEDFDDLGRYEFRVERESFLLLQDGDELLLCFGSLAERDVGKREVCPGTDLVLRYKGRILNYNLENVNGFAEVPGIIENDCPVYVLVDGRGRQGEAGAKNKGSGKQGDYLRTMVFLSVSSTGISMVCFH